MSVVLFAALALGQCSGGSCSPSFSPAFLPQYQPVQYQPLPVQQVAEEPAEYGWRWVEYCGVKARVWGKILGNGNVVWNPEAPGNAKAIMDATAQKLADEKRLADSQKPTPSVEQPKPAAENFGLDTRRIGKRVGYSGNVREYGQSTAGKVFLTVIGSKQDRAQVVNDWNTHAAFASSKSDVEFNEFEVGDWQIKDELGFNAKGSPTILIQHPDGKVAWRAYEYGGPEEVQQALVGALRKPDPNYRPERDPGPHSKPEPFLGLDPGIGLVVLTVAAALFILPRRPK
jgi:hypothetical protein